MTRKKIYTYRIATVFLVFYSFFLIFAAFHTHKSNLQNGSSYHSEESKSSNKQTDPFLDGNSKCRLYYFTTDKFIFTPTIDLSVVVPQESSNQQIDYTNHYLTKYFYNFDLRAPPTIS
jgi:hypothetical protein